MYIPHIPHHIASPTPRQSPLPASTHSLHTIATSTHGPHSSNYLDPPSVFDHLSQDETRRFYAGIDMHVCKDISIANADSVQRYQESPGTQ